MPTDNLLQKFVEYVQCNHMFESSDKILLAVSGGVDSVVMTDLFKKAGFRFGIAHCNFHLRGDDSDSDENFVRSLAEKHHVPIYCASFDTKSYAKEQKLSIEEAARKLRYDFFHTTAQKYAYQYIATAHHNNDAIETLFINLIRGTGITGLHGIRPVNGDIIRPLLTFSRQEIKCYATLNELPYHEDYTNNETIFLRNKIRQQLIPLLKEISPQIEKTMMRNMANFSDAEEIYHAAIEEKRKEIVTQKNGKYYLTKSKIRKLKPANAYMFEFLRDFGFNSTTTTQILMSLDKIGSSFFSATHTVLIDRNHIIIKQLQQSSDTSEYLIYKNATSTEVPVKLIFETSDNIINNNTHTDNNTIIVDHSKLQYPLILRKWRHGDRFQPFGMIGKRKVSDFFKDNHLSLFEKNEKWFLCNNDGKIIWIVGMRMDNHFRVNLSTTKVTKIIFCA